VVVSLERVISKYSIKKKDAIHSKEKITLKTNIDMWVLISP